MMNMTTEYGYTVNSCFHDLRKGVIPKRILDTLVEMFAECPQVMAVVSATEYEGTDSILGAMVLAFAAGCQFRQIHGDIFTDEKRPQ